MLVITVHDTDGRQFGSLGLNELAEKQFWTMVKAYNLRRRNKGEPDANPAEVLDYLLSLGMRLKSRVLNGV